MPTLLPFLLMYLIATEKQTNNLNKHKEEFYKKVQQMPTMNNDAWCRSGNRRDHKMHRFNMYALMCKLNGSLLDSYLANYAEPDNYILFAETTHMFAELSKLIASNRKEMIAQGGIKNWTNIVRFRRLSNLAKDTNLATEYYNQITDNIIPIAVGHYMPGMQYLEYDTLYGSRWATAMRLLTVSSSRTNIDNLKNIVSTIIDDVTGNRTYYDNLYDATKVCDAINKDIIDINDRKRSICNTVMDLSRYPERNPIDLKSFEMVNGKYTFAVNMLEYYAYTHMGCTKPILTLPTDDELVTQKFG